MLNQLSPAPGSKITGQGRQRVLAQERERLPKRA